MALNGITDPRTLQVGRVLQVSGSATVTAPPAPTTFPEPVADAVVPENAPTPITLPVETGGPVAIRSVQSDPVDLNSTAEEEPDLDFNNVVDVPVTRIQD